MIAKTGRAAAATTILLFCTTSAFAVDATAFADRLKTVLSGQDMAFTYGSAQANGDNVVLKDVSLKQGEQSQTLGDLTFQSVSGSTADGWTVETVDVPDVKREQGPFTTTLNGMSIDGLQIKGTQTDASDQAAVKQFSNLFFDHATVGSVSVKRDGTDLYGAQSIDIANTISDGGTLNSKFGIDSFKANLAAANDEPGATATLKQMGYETIDGSMNGTAIWDPDSGKLQLDPFNVDVKDAGNLSFTYDISGYTPDFLKSLQQLQAQMAQNPENRQQSGMALMGLLAQLSLGSADITFVDDSLTGKLLDFYAKRGDTTREQLVQNVTDRVSSVLSALNDPNFRNEVSSAVSTFLKDPQSLSIAIAPQNPIPATQIIGTAMTSPETLPQVLSLNVTANQASMPASAGGGQASGSNN